MSILVKKGQKTDMTKAYSGLQKLRVQMYWNIVDLNPTAFEIDAAAFILGVTGKTAKDEDFIFYNNYT